MTQTSALDDRYGNTLAVRRSRRRGLWALAVMTAVLLGVWFVWANPIGLGPSVTARDTGHAVDSDKTVQVRFEVTVTPGHDFACAVEALNTSFAIVGWKVVSYPASSVLTSVKTVTLKTTEPATTGFVSGCWLT